MRAPRPGTTNLAVDALSPDPSRKQRWDTDGWCVVEGLVPPDEVAAAQAALPDLFPTAEDFAADRDPERNRPFRAAADAVLAKFPFESPALNRLVLHDRLVALAEELSGTTDLRLYQGMASAKYAGGAPDYEQLLHVDYGNHTLVVPRADVGYQQVEFFVYLSDVTEGTAPTKLVPRPLTAGIPVNRTYLAPDQYPELYAAEVPATGPAGSVLAYRPDTYHRGTAPTDPGSARFILHVAYQPAGRDWLGYQAWPSAAEGLAWFRLVGACTVRQLVLMGFPAPGDPYWNDETLDGVAARYPALDLAPWRAARG